MLSKVLSMLVIFTVMISCGTQSYSNSTPNSVIDGNQRIFGLVTNPANGMAEFRLCRGTMLPASALNDTNICINPYLTNDGQPLSVTAQNFDDVKSAEKYFKSVGYAKGGTIGLAGAATGVVAGYVVFGVGSIFIFPTWTMNALFSTGFGSWEAAQLSLWTLSGAGGAAGGFSIWGRDDRETARSFNAVLGDFYAAKQVPDTKQIVKKIAAAAQIAINPATESF